jgi:hypothetical protein
LNEIDRINQLTQISEQLATILNSTKRNISSTGFWTGIILTIITMMATAFLSFGSLRSDVINHINNKSIHLSPKQAAELVINTRHIEEFTREKLDKIYARRQDLEKLEKRVEKLEDTKNAN